MNFTQDIVLGHGLLSTLLIVRISNGTNSWLYLNYFQSNHVHSIQMLVSKENIAIHTLKQAKWLTARGEPTNN